MTNKKYGFVSRRVLTLCLLLLWVVCNVTAADIAESVDMTLSDPIVAQDNNGANVLFKIVQNNASSSNHGNTTDKRALLEWKRHDETTCKGATLERGEKLGPDESICAVIQGEMVYYGMRTYQVGEDSTEYREEVWSESGNYDKWFQSITMQTSQWPYSPKYIAMQGDGNLLFFGQSTGCRAKHAYRGPGVRAEMGGPLPTLMAVYDDMDNVLWEFQEMVHPYNEEKYVGRTGCHFQEEPKCVSVLHEGEFLSWNEYICEYDQAGNVVTRFGLGKNGKFGLWRNGELVWRPPPKDSRMIRGDYLRLQRDGHITLFYYQFRKPDSGTKYPGLTYTWASYCRGAGKSKLSISDGDVHQFNEDGSVAWALTNFEGKPQPVCFKEGDGCPIYGK